MKSGDILSFNWCNKMVWAILVINISNKGVTDKFAFSIFHGNYLSIEEKMLLELFIKVFCPLLLEIA